MGNEINTRFRKKMIENLINDPLVKVFLLVGIFMAGVALYTCPKMWRDDKRLSRGRR